MLDADLSGQKSAFEAKTMAILVVVTNTGASIASRSKVPAGCAHDL